MALLQPRSSRRVADEVYRILHRRIIDGELAPGARVEVDHVARELDVSRTPVREAILRLDSTGMVERQPYRGTVVTGVDQTRLEEITALRFEFEGLAAELGVPRLTAGEIERMARIQERIEDLAEDNDFGPGAFNELNRQFHGVLYSAANAPSLLRIVQGLSAEAERMRLHFPTVAGPADAYHRAILDACRRRDPTAVKDATRVHLVKAYLAMSGMESVAETGILAIVLRDAGLDITENNTEPGRTTP